ncbi:hypothetical protein AVEN_203467-1 [Araneus ventricosus]|uniref:Uncharacterized protein n=1 Tax=Araneus ventricosus TaxID=182803 RepID=A0A4Y2BH80_ARAVE|nr:hypothetical protein AVEN_203467-1 [Araneus ventricosus]
MTIISLTNTSLNAFSKVYFLHTGCDICRWRTEPSCDSRLSVRFRHWGHAASPGTFSDVGTDGSRWEQDRDCRRDGQTPPSEKVQQLLCAQCRMRASVVVEQSPLQHLKKFLLKQNFPSEDDVHTGGCLNVVFTDWLRSPTANLFELFTDIGVTV